MIELQYDDSKISLEQISENTYNVYLVNDMILNSGKDTILKTSISLSFETDHELVLFAGSIADETDAYNNIFISSSLYDKNDDERKNVKIYFYNCNEDNITLPSGKIIGQLRLLLSYSENINENYDKQKVIYDSNGLRVIPTESYTESIEKTEIDVDSEGNKILKIFYPTVE